MIDLGYGQCGERDKTGEQCPKAAINDSGQCFEHMEEAIRRTTRRPTLTELRIRELRDSARQRTHYGYEDRPA